MKYVMRAGLPLVLAVCLLLGLTGCGAAARPTDEWHLGPPESAESSGVATAPDSGDSTSATDTTGPETGTSDSTTVTETTKTTKKATHPKVETPADDPQRPKEEEREGETGSVVTLPPITTSTTTTTKITVTTQASTGTIVPDHLRHFRHRYNPNHSAYHPSYQTSIQRNRCIDFSIYN